MKTTTKILIGLVLLAFLGCSNEPVGDEQSGDSDVTSIDSTPIDNANDTNDTTSTNEDGPCVTTTLVAGQHYEAGTVTIDIEGDFLIVTYTVTGDWTIGTTHLSIGDCSEDWIPLNGAGNPQIGQFEFTEPTSITDNEVVYMIPLPEGFEGQDYCFAAHAEVQGPTGGETAWAEGQELSGNSWAMYDEFNTSTCTSGDVGVY